MLEDYCDTSLQVSQTPAHWVAMQGRLDVLKVLHQNGADLSLRDKVSVTCIPTTGSHTIRLLYCNIVTTVT